MKQSKNAIALQANQQALEKAIIDLDKANKKVRELERKIPQLRSAVSSLEALCGVKSKPAAIAQPVSAPDSYPGDVGSTPASGSAFPPELLVMEPLPSMDGITSIPAPREPKITPSAGNVAQQVKRETGFV